MGDGGRHLPGGDGTRSGVRDRGREAAVDTDAVDAGAAVARFCAEGPGCSGGLRRPGGETAVRGGVGGA